MRAGLSTRLGRVLMRRGWGRGGVVGGGVGGAGGGRADEPAGGTLARACELIGEHSQGMHAERFVAPAANLADLGDADPAKAAAFGLVTLTAYSMMVTKAQL